MQNLATRVTQVLCGLAIVAIDIRAGGFDILPNFVGYILIALGAAGLVEWSPRFQTARTLSWVLVGTQIASMIFRGSFLTILGLTSLVVNGALIWFLLGGIMAFAQNRNQQNWVTNASKYRLAYLGLVAIAFANILLAFVLPRVAGFVSTITGIATLVLVAAIAYLFYQVRSAVKGTSAPENPFKAPESANEGSPSPGQTLPQESTATPAPAASESAVPNSSQTGESFEKAA